MKIEDLAAQIPPNDIGVENAVIGSLFVSSEDMPPLVPEEFFSERNRVVWQAMIDLADLEGKFDLLTVAAHLKSKGKLEDAGGVAHLALCLEQGCITIRVKELSRVIRDHARQRQVIALGISMVRQGYSGSADQVELSRRIEELPGPMASAIYDPAVNWHSIVERWGEKSVLTGWPKLDEVLCGIHPGDLMVVGGRTSHGKTAFATALSRRLAGFGHPNDYLTLEETQNAITRRWVSQISGVQNYKIKDGSLAPSDIEACEQAIIQLQGLPVTCTALDTIGNLDEDTVVGMVAHSKSKIVFVDHLQKIQTRNPSRVYGLESALNRIHAVAIRQQKSVIIMSQLSRLMETEKRRPQLSDLRDSGATEQSARQILLLWWPHKMAPDDHTVNHYEIDIAKNTDSGTAVVPMLFDPRCGRFEDPSMPGQVSAGAPF